MISQSEALAAVRFGFGLSPDATPPDGAEALMQGLSSEDGSAPDTPDLAARLAIRAARSELRKERRKLINAGQDETAVREQEAELRQQYGQIATGDLRHMLSSAIDGPGFRERLVFFWADHFTTSYRSIRDAIFGFDLINTAVRPHVAGRFPDMLRAVSTHPAMLIYLDQHTSIGPNSRIGQNRRRGLNENLAREILELHTLGVKGSYAQTDVREFAELLTGMTLNAKGFQFNRRMAEPGAETVLGQDYGGDGRARLRDIHQALDDIALHPDTAKHLAEKLCVHFIGGTPDAGQMEAMAAAYLKNDGALRPMLSAMLDHPAAWAPELQKAKPPLDFVISALRALKPHLPPLESLGRRELQGGIVSPIADMGQPFFAAAGPDGWPEAPEAWITPAGLTARLLWIQRTTKAISEEIDPRAFLEETLGPLASPTLEFAAAGAETRREGIALVLASPEFNRR